ncbi:hypothetical protein BASA81_000337 [Batrachochytrium salamandrivorans]|nr:hypothetical protein BASA81_000337 [Batrachochytrium salamandrivorans]
MTSGNRYYTQLYFEDTTPLALDAAEDGALQAFLRMLRSTHVGSDTFDNSDGTASVLAFLGPFVIELVYPPSEQAVPVVVGERVFDSSRWTHVGFTLGSDGHPKWSPSPSFVARLPGQCSFSEYNLCFTLSANYKASPTLSLCHIWFCRAEAIASGPREPWIDWFFYFSKSSPPFACVVQEKPRGTALKAHSNPFCAPLPEHALDIAREIWDFLHTCAKCSKIGNAPLQTCSRCEVMRYCSRECQSQDWRRHKKECPHAASALAIHFADAMQ